jgi:hypothetical protein
MGDCAVWPLSDAVIVDVPGTSAVIVNVALDEPAGIVTDVGTLATTWLLLASETLAPPAGAGALRVTVPCPALPAVRVVAFSVTETDMLLVGPVGDEPPH